MAQTASWGPKAFGIDTDKIVPLMDLKVSMSVKSDSQGDSSGTSQKNLQGREPEVVSLATQYLRATGSDPWAQVEEWRDLQGKVHPLYIGGKQFGKNQFMLQSAEVSDILMTNSGDFLGLKVSITLEEVVVKVQTKATTEKTHFDDDTDTDYQYIYTGYKTTQDTTGNTVNLANTTAGKNLIDAINSGVTYSVYNGLSSSQKESLKTSNNRTSTQVADPTVYLSESQKAAAAAAAAEAAQRVNAQIEAGKAASKK